MQASCGDKFNDFARSGRRRRSEPKVARADRRRAINISYIIQQLFRLTPSEQKKKPRAPLRQTPEPDL